MSVLEVLSTNPNADSEQMGDTFMFPASHRDMSQRKLAGVFGSEFAAQVVEWREHRSYSPHATA